MKEDPCRFTSTGTLRPTRPSSTSSAWLLGNNGHEVRLWARDADLAATAQRERRNPHYLPDLELPDTVRVTSDLEEAVAPNGYMFAVVPVKAMATVMGRLRQAGAAPRGIVSCSKGLQATDSAGDREAPRAGRGSAVRRGSVPARCLYRCCRRRCGARR